MGLQKAALVGISVLFIFALIVLRRNDKIDIAPFIAGGLVAVLAISTLFIYDVDKKNDKAKVASKQVKVEQTKEIEKTALETKEDKDKQKTEDNKDKQKTERKIVQTEDTKKEIYDDVEDLLSSFFSYDDDGNKVGPEQTLESMMNNEIGFSDVMTDEVKEKLHMVDQMDSLGGEKHTIEVLLTMAYLYDVDPQEDPVLMREKYSEYITLDIEHGYAHLPLDLFSPSLLGYTGLVAYDFEDNMWKLDPYNIVQQFRLVDAITAPFYYPADNMDLSDEAVSSETKVEDGIVETENQDNDQHNLPEDKPQN